MPIFHYRGYRTDGTEITGTIEASGMGDAIGRIKGEGIFPSAVTEPHIASRRGPLRRTDSSFLPQMTRQLSTLLSAGVPLMDALTSLTGEYHGFYKGMLIALKERVSGGMALYRALEDFPEHFPAFYRNMIQAGIASGTLDSVLTRLADFLEKQNAIRSRVRASMAYPLLMIGVSIVVLSFLFTFVIPKIVKIFRDTHSTLPFITVILISLSSFLTKYWWALLGGSAAGSFALRRFFRSRRLLLHKAFLKLPGNVIQSLYYTRFARTLGFLLEGGLPMIHALHLSAKATGNNALEASILHTAGKVIEGQSLSVSLEGFPPVLIQLIATGEKSGRLPETLNRAADSYEETFNRRVNQVIGLLEPAMILVMGLIVGSIVFAVLLPMFQLNQLVK